MIELTRLNHQKLILNADLIKWIEANPDTVITLISGEKMLVLESSEQVVRSVMEYRRAVLRGLDPGAWARSTALIAGMEQETSPESGEGDEQIG